MMAARIEMKPFEYFDIICDKFNDFFMKAFLALYYPQRMWKA